MGKIVLISCVSKKQDYNTKAREMYISPLFKKAFAYACSLNPDKVFILSAKYGLIDMDQEIEPYELTLNKMNKDEIKKWAEEVLVKLKQETNLQNDEFIFLAGEKYRKYIIPYLIHYSVPMKGLGIGKQLKFLKDRLK